MASKLCITVLSGGMDSTTLAYQINRLGYKQNFISYDYGQRHVRELECAITTAEKLKGEHHIIKMTSQETSTIYISAPKPLGAVLKGSALTDDVAVPEGHYEEENMALTIVPGRNAIMLSIAWGIAVANGATLVATGVHAGDHAIYPDCRQDFMLSLQAALNIGVAKSKSELALFTPFINFSKAAILKLGLEIGVPYEDTWTCYKGEDKACGVCGSCCERLASFDEAGVEDPLKYENRTTWQKFVAAFKAKQTST